MNQVKRIEIYIYEFFLSRFEHLNHFYITTHRDRRTGIYLLKRGSELMDFLMSIHGNMEEQFFFEKLIPQKFASPSALFAALNSFKIYLNENQKLLDINLKGEETSYIVDEIQRIKEELIQMIEYAKQIYDYEDTTVPYQELRYKLLTRNIPDFIKILKSILASVSYAIAKTQEGYFHSNIHLILKLLGFEILSEELTNVGRIDAVIRFSDIFYIVEFKFNENDDLSKEALRQIVDKNYAQKFVMERKEIIAVGISFGEKERNINGYVFKNLDEKT